MNDVNDKSNKPAYNLSEFEMPAQRPGGPGDRLFASLRRRIKPQDDPMRSDKVQSEGTQMVTDGRQPTERLAGELPLDTSLAPEVLLERLRMNALMAHQHAVGRGDALVEILRRTIAQMEKTHNRIQNMSTALFVAGMVMIAAGIYGAVFGGQGQGVWAALLGGVGGVTAVVATFYTTPVEKISDSITDLVKLETAFLGYIRVIGELDSAFQMQYLDILAGSRQLSLDSVINDTTGQMKEIMEHTMMLIDKYLGGDNKAMEALKEQAGAMDKRLQALEGKETSG